MHGFLSVVGVLMVIFGVIIFVMGPTAIQQNLAVNVFGFGLLSLGVGSMVEELRRIRKRIEE